MSELDEKLWAVLSERGLEAANVTYAEALRRLDQLAGEGVHGLCIITNEAAQRLTHDAKREDI